MQSNVIPLGRLRQSQRSRLEPIALYMIRPSAAGEARMREMVLPQLPAQNPSSFSLSDPSDRTHAFIAGRGRWKGTAWKPSFQERTQWRVGFHPDPTGTLRRASAENHEPLRHITTILGVLVSLGGTSDWIGMRWNAAIQCWAGRRESSGTWSVPSRFFALLRRPSAGATARCRDLPLRPPSLSRLLGAIGSAT